MDTGAIACLAQVNLAQVNKEKHPADAGCFLVHAGGCAGFIQSFDQAYRPLL